jgi:hypothetical protein
LNLTGIRNQQAKNAENESLCFGSRRLRSIKASVGPPRQDPAKVLNKVTKQKTTHRYIRGRAVKIEQAMLAIIKEL